MPRNHIHHATIIILNSGVADLDAASRKGEENCNVRKMFIRSDSSDIALAAIPCSLAASALGADVRRHSSAKDSKAPPKPQNVLSPDAALKKLMEGNARYVDGTARRHDFKHEREALVGGQNPYAAILSCADSRIAPEYAFDSGAG